MSTADRLRAQGKRVAAQPSNRSEASKEARKKTRPATRTEPIGKTVKLPPTLNDRILDWQRKTARDLGLGRVTFQQTSEALLLEMLSDPDLSDRVRTRISDASR